MAHPCRGRNQDRMLHPTQAAMPLRRAVLAASMLLALTLRPAAAPAPLTAVPVVTGLDRPLVMVPWPGRPDTFLVAEQAGLVRLIVDDAVRPEPFLDLRDQIAAGGERGLLGLATAPDFPSSGRFYVCSTNRSGDTVVARFRIASGEPLRAERPTVKVKPSICAITRPGAAAVSPGGRRRLC